MAKSCLQRQKRFQWSGRHCLTHFLPIFRINCVGHGVGQIFSPSESYNFLHSKMPRKQLFSGRFVELVGWLEHLTCWLRISCSTDWATLAYAVACPIRARESIAYFTGTVNTYFPPIFLSKIRSYSITNCIFEGFPAFFIQSFCRFFVLSREKVSFLSAGAPSLAY